MKEVESENGMKKRFAAWYSRFWDGLGSSYVQEKGIAVDPTSMEWSREFMIHPVADILFASGAYAKLNTVKALASLVLAACVAATVCVVAGAPVVTKLGAFGVAVLVAVGSWVMYGLGFNGDTPEMDAGMRLFDNARDMRWLLDKTEEYVSSVVLYDSRAYGTPVYERGKTKEQWDAHQTRLVCWRIDAASPRKEK